MAVKPHEDAPWRGMANKGKDNSTYTEGGAAHAKMTYPNQKTVMKDRLNNAFKKLAAKNK